MRDRAAVVILLTFSLTILLGSCKQADPVEQRIGALIKAAEERDAGSVAESFSEQFVSAGGENKAQLMEEIRRYLFAYRQISVQKTDEKIARGEDRAEVDLLLDIHGIPKEIAGLDQLVPRSAKLRLHLELKKEGSAWLVSGAQWEVENQGG